MSDFGTMREQKLLQLGAGWERRAQKKGPNAGQERPDCPAQVIFIFTNKILDLNYFHFLIQTGQMHQQKAKIQIKTEIKRGKNRL